MIWNLLGYISTILMFIALEVMMNYLGVTTFPLVVTILVIVALAIMLIDVISKLAFEIVRRHTNQMLQEALIQLATAELEETKDENDDSGDEP